MYSTYSHTWPCVLRIAMRGHGRSAGSVCSSALSITRSRVATPPPSVRLPSSPYGTYQIVKARLALAFGPSFINVFSCSIFARMRAQSEGGCRGGEQRGVQRHRAVRECALRHGRDAATPPPGVQGRYPGHNPYSLTGVVVGRGVGVRGSGVGGQELMKGLGWGFGCRV